MVSAWGEAPVWLEYQRQYWMRCPTPEERSSTGDMREVVPPSTSFSPSVPPGEPWPVNQQLAPGAVWSFSGCAAVPIGSPCSQVPVLAPLGFVSPQPWGPASKSWSSTTTCVPTLKLSGSAAPPSGKEALCPAESVPLTKYDTTAAPWKFGMLAS